MRWLFVLLAAACGSRTEPSGDSDASSKPFVRCSVRGPTPLASRQGPLALAVDATHVYWLNEENPFSTLELRRVGKGGGLVETVATFPLEDANVQIAVSADDVYVVTGTNLVRVAKDGRSVTTVARLPMKGAYALTLDDTAAYLANGKSLLGISLAGGNTRTLAPRAIHVAIDAERAFFSEVFGSKILAVPLSGGTASELTDLRTKFQTRGPGAIAVDDAFVYTTADLPEPLPSFAVHGVIVRTPKNADAVEQIARTENGPLRLVLSESDVYFTDYYPSGLGAVRKVPKAGGAVVVVADGQEHPQTLAIDDRCVYWGDLAEILGAYVPAPSTTIGSIMAAPK